MDSLIKTLFRLIFVSALAVAAPSVAAEIVYYIHVDHLGSPILETDQQGNVVRMLDYRPYGEEVLDTAKDGPAYTGHYRDAATGLVYMQQRYYDPAAGRFMSVDPVLPNTTDGSNFNRYGYANNNPYRYLDPDGRYPCVVAPPAPICAAAGAKGVAAVKGTAAGATILSSIASITRGMRQQDESSDSEASTGERGSDTSASARDKIFAGTRPAIGVSGERGEREADGGRAARDQDLEGVPGERTSPREGVTVIPLPDGGHVEGHDSTKSRDYPPGTPTIKVQDADGNVIGTVRYPEREY